MWKNTGGSGQVIEEVNKKGRVLVQFDGGIKAHVFLKELEEYGGIKDETRAMLAQEVFTIMADYNATISNYLQNL